MANNRMKLVNRRTEQAVLLAKFYPSTGWFAYDDLAENLNAALDAANFSHLTKEERQAKAAKVGFGPPYACGGMDGERWELVYEDDPDSFEYEGCIAGWISEEA